MKQSGFDTNDVKKCCEKKLDITFRDGKELNGWFRLGGRKATRITVPKGRKNIPPKTYKSMASQLKLNAQQFDELLECTLMKDDYEELLRKYLAPLADRSDAS
jgi:hypothetical protein